MSETQRLDIKYSYLSVPTCQEFALDDTFIRGLMGPFGSGKSSACVAELVNRGLAQKKGRDGVRRTRFAVIRNTYAELRDTTIKTIMQWLPEMYFGRYIKHERTYTITAFPEAQIELIFLALDRPDDIKKLLSLELTGAWVNEAREIPWSIIEALQGRVGRYPAVRDGGCTWFGIWMDTNPPDNDSRWYKFFEEIKPVNARIFKQPSGRAYNAENLGNLPGGQRYYTNLAIGKKAEWIKVYVDGEYGFVVDGKPVFPEYNDRVHCQDVDPIPGVTIIRSWDFGLCYSDDTEVLTDSGWKLFKDVDENKDRAASRDPMTGRIEFTPIVFKIAKPFKGDLLHWKNTELDMLVTPEHRVPFTYRDTPSKVHWQSAQWLADHMSGHHYIDLVSDWEPEPAPIECGHADERRFSARNFAELMGLYLSEGSTYLPKGKVSIYQNNRDPEMQRILDETGLNWSWRPEGKAAGWWITDHALCRMLAQYGKAAEKRVPAIIKRMGRAEQQAFIDAYTLGDGHRRTRNGGEEHTIFSTSKVMIDDLQEMAQLVGWNSSVRRVKPQTSYLDGRRIDNNGGWSITFKKRAKRAELLARNFSRVPYDGMVYCLNVPWHTLYVRRNGKPHWNGNTPACAFSQILPSGQWLTFDEMTSDGMSIDKFSDDVILHCNRAFRGDGVRFEDWGDPAGQQRAQTDLKTCFDIMQAKGIMVEGSIQNPQMRHESIGKPLRTLVDGEPQFILHSRCKNLRKGFMGGYHYRRLQVSGERYSDKVEKNHLSHIMEALEYGTVQYFAPALTGQAPDDDYPDFDHSDYIGGDDGRSAFSGY